MSPDLSWCQVKVDEKQKKITDCVCFIGEECMRHKILSIMMHDSQDPPMVRYLDKDPFYEKIKIDKKPF